MIDSKDISVIVQGAIDNINTKKCLKSVRKHLPGAVIILSTWQGSDVSGLDYDVLVESRDPGAEIYDEVYKLKNNVNRQILSTKSAFEKVTTKYILKLRSDMAIESPNFLKYFGKYQERAHECKILNQRVVINSLYCRNFEHMKLLFHPSDWVFFGLSEDIKNIWDIELQKEPESSNYFKNKPRPEVDIFSTWMLQLLPEQYLWTTFLKKNNINLNFEYFTDINQQNINLSELSLINNLVVVDYEDFGIKFLKYNPYKWNFDYKVNITFYDWLGLYKKHCCPDFKIHLTHKIHQKQLQVHKRIHKILQKIKYRIKYRQNLNA